MKGGAARILTINGGSSSIKFALFEAGAGCRQVFRGAIERIGRPEATLKITDDSGNVARPVPAENREAAVDTLVKLIRERTQANGLEAIGHRIVQGGPKYSRPDLITGEMVEELNRLSAFDSEHLPTELLLIEAFRGQFTGVPEVACFDTAFHHDLPRVARVLAIPRRYEAQGVRRYGFHGLSYEYLLGELARVAGAEARGRVILAHLGSGASMAAVRDGKPIDTSMSFTPTAGLVMGTRSGDLDPGLCKFFAQSEQMTAAQFDQMVNHESGMLGISETSSDIRDLLARESEDSRAKEAVDLFCYQGRKWIGFFAAALGGLDTLVFSGGIGENAPLIRERICAGLGFLGIEIDRKRNDEGAPLISTDAGSVRVRVIATDEELMIARSAAEVLERVTK